MYTAIPAAIHVPFHAPGLRKKEISFFNVYRSNHQTDRARDLLGANLKLFAPLVTHSRPLDQIGEAFDIAHSYEDGVGKMVVMPSAG